MNDMNWINKLKAAVNLFRSPKQPDLPKQQNFSQDEAALFPATPLERLGTLTNRERQVFQLLIMGKKLKEIAEELGVKLTTVSFHQQGLYKKLAVNSRAQMFVLYAEHAKTIQTQNTKK